MKSLFKALLKLLKGKVKIHIGSPGGPGIDINLAQKQGLLGSEKLEMNYSILIGLWKAFRSALFATLALLLASGGLDLFFDNFTSGIGLIGLPTWLVPVLIGVITLVRNFLKQLVNSYTAQQK
jgi:hypothetical protein